MVPRAAPFGSRSGFAVLLVVCKPDGWNPGMYGMHAGSRGKLLVAIGEGALLELWHGGVELSDGGAPRFSPDVR